MYKETFAMRLRPPMMTLAVNAAQRSPAMAVEMETEWPPILMNSPVGTIVATAVVMPFTCVIVPIPNMPARTPKIANKIASQRKLRPKRSLMPVSI